MAYFRSCGIKQVEVSARVIYQALPIARHVTGIEILVISVAAYILAEGCARIDVANSFVVGEKVDALAHPARVGNVPIELEQSLERSVTADIAPQVPNPAAPVAFLVGKIPHVYIAAEHDAPVGAI